MMTSPTNAMIGPQPHLHISDKFADKLVVSTYLIERLIRQYLS